MGEYKPMPGDISIYKYQSHIVRQVKIYPTTFPPFPAGMARLYLTREVKKPTDPAHASHPSRSRTRCDPSGRCWYQGAETPPGHCDATPAKAAPRECIRGRTPTGSSSPGAGPRGAHARGPCAAETVLLRLRTRCAPGRWCGH